MSQENQSMPASFSDAELIARAQRGEESAFEALYHAHKRRVYHLCFRMVGNTAEAEELTQEAFLRLFRKIHMFRGDSAFSTWLHRLSVNVVLMRLRKKRVKEISFESGDDGQESERPPRDFGAPDLSLNGVVDRLTLKRAVAKLPKGCRKVFVLHDVLGSSITKSRRSWATRSAIPSRSCTRLACGCANSWEPVCQTRQCKRNVLRVYERFFHAVCAQVIMFRSDRCAVAYWRCTGSSTDQRIRIQRLAFSPSQQHYSVVVTAG